MKVHADESLSYLFGSNQIAPDYAGIELGIGETIIIKAIAEGTGRKVADVKRDLENLGDLGTVCLVSFEEEGRLSRIERKETSSKICADKSPPCLRPTDCFLSIPELEKGSETNVQTNSSYRTKALRRPNFNLFRNRYWIRSKESQHHLTSNWSLSRK